MEEIVQRVFAIIFVVIVFFVMPIYMTFEKRDDISYALALKITSTFVNDVKAKGYLTADMYSDYVSELAATDNKYEIKLEHISRSYNPVINVYDENSRLIDSLDYNIYKEQYEIGEIKSKNFDGAKNIYSYKNNNTFEVTYKLASIIYNQEQIIDFLNQTDNEYKNYLNLTEEEYRKITDISGYPVNYTTSEGLPIYTMSVGDEFGVIIKNENITIASVLFDALTFNGITSQIPRVYINYGGTIKNEEYKELI